MGTNVPKELTRRQLLFVGVATATVACGSDPMPSVADAAPDAAPDVAPDATPDAAPDAAPDVAPDATPDAAPDAAPDVAPDATPDAAPDGGSPCPPAGAMRLGTVADFPMGSWRAVRTPNVIVGRDARGLFAYSAVCTHSGCTVPPPMSSTSGSTCPCHGSRFNNDGMVTGGPATRSLNNFRVVVCGGEVYLQPDMIVPIGTRTPV
jgi:Rieske Fe-S protein